MDVGFIGLGRMGSAMARNIGKAGHQVHAWNRSAVPGTTADGIAMVASPADAFQADAVFTMLSDDAAIRDVLLDSGALRGARRGVVHVVTSTISVAFAEELAARHAELGIGYVAAPVFGRPDVAAAGQLGVVAAGDPAAVDKVRPLLDAVGRHTWVIGAQPSQANALKIAGNMMIAMAIEAMAEAVALTSSKGIAPAQFFDVILNSLFGCRVYESYSANIVNSNYEPRFAMRLGLKDVNLAAAVASATGKHFPMLDAVRARMTEAVEAGMGERDWSAIADYMLRDGG